MELIVLFEAYKNAEFEHEREEALQALLWGFVSALNSIADAVVQPAEPEAPVKKG